MDCPGNRARPQVREHLRYKGRSKSAHTLKNSSYYEKFLFFENKFSDNATAKVDASCVANSVNLLNRSLASAERRHVEGILSAVCFDNQQEANKHIKFISPPFSTRKSASTLTISQQRQNNVLISSVYRCQRQGDASHRQVLQSPKANTFTRETNGKRDWSSYASRSSYINKRNPLQNALAHFKPENASLTNSGHKQQQYFLGEKSELKSSLSRIPTTTSSRTDVPHSKIVSDNKKLALDLIANNTRDKCLIQNSSNRRDSFSDLKVSVKTSSSSQTPALQFDSYSTWPESACLKRSISDSSLTGNITKKETISKSYTSESSAKFQAVSNTCSSPHLEQVTLSIREDTETPVREISKANIILKSSNLAKEKGDRKIHVIETRHSMPSMTVDTSPRLNEWLSSVMKLQTEQEDKDQWNFPEDENNAFNAHLVLQPFYPQNKANNSNEEFNRTQFGHKQCLSRGINTDVSFAAEDIHPDPFTGKDDVKRFSTIKHIERHMEDHQKAKYDSSLSHSYSQHCTCCKNKLASGGCTWTGQQSSSCSKRCGTTVYDSRHCQCVHFIESKPHLSSIDQTLHSTRQSLQGDADRGINKPQRSKKYLDSDITVPGIKIQVTGEEDHIVNAFMKSICAEKIDNTHMPESDYCEQGYTSNVDATERTLVPRGVSPHYIFPCNRPTWEEGDMSRYLMSPRNSVGSVSSMLSYKSSNADSAVDLAPPDDDQDFEYVDFLQARKLSNPNNCLLEERQVSEYSLANDPSETLSNMYRSIYRVDPIMRGLHTAAVRKYYKSDPYNTRNQFDFTSPELSSSIISNCQDKQPHLPLDGTDYVPEKDLMFSGPFIRRHSLKEATCYKDSASSNSQNGYLLYETKTFATDIPLDNIQSFQETNLMETVTETAFLSEPVDDSSLQCVPQQVRRNHTYHELSQHLIIPELVISDHSDTRSSQENSPTLQLEHNLDSESPLPSRSESSLGFSEHDQLDGENNGFLRSHSVSSLCSVASTCSTCSIISDSEETPVKKQSSWKKIRSFILWSPFVQVFKKHKYPWIQLAGHQGNFHAGEAGSVLKKLDSREQASFHKLMADSLKEFVPEYMGDVEKNGETYIQLQDLLCSFTHPCVMDVKMGVRTYLEDELQKARRSPTLRKDMYQKMIEIDCSAPTSEEHEQKAVTKPRYMQWRDEMSSSVELGFRVEGIKRSDGNSSKDFKKTKTRDSIVDTLKSFAGVNEIIVTKYINRLKELMNTQETSTFFQSHEVIGSSLLFVHDSEENVGVWMIDFGKSEPLPRGVKIDHRSKWHEGNHEDGYLFGLDNLISVLEEVQKSFISSSV